MGEMGSSEALFSNKNNTLGSGSKVYTEDVGGSSPSSPTNFFNDLADPPPTTATKTVDGELALAREPIGKRSRLPAFRPLLLLDDEGGRASLGQTSPRQARFG